MSFATIDDRPKPHVGWWAILGAKANHTYAMAQSSSSPNKVPDIELSSPLNLRKRDKLKSFLRKKRSESSIRPQASEDNVESVPSPGTPTKGTLSSKLSKMLSSRAESVFCSFSSPLMKKNAIDPTPPSNPCDLGPGKATTWVTPVEVSTAWCARNIRRRERLFESV